MTLTSGPARAQLTLDVPPLSKTPIPLDDKPPSVPVGIAKGYPGFEADDGRYVPYSVHIVPRQKKLDRENFDEPVEPEEVDFPSRLSAVFTTPAHFPKWGFTQCGRQVPLRGLLIYEGMTVALGDHGEYEVRCTVEAPQTPVVVHLQLVVAKQVTEPTLDGNQYRQAELGTITLPPITLVPEENQNFIAHDSRDRHQPSRTYHIRQRGYSHVLRALSREIEDRQNWTVTRKGTARFGSVPD
jgi:hypothetical protein